MARVECEIVYDSEENEDGYEVDCVRAICTKCGHETMSFGDSEASIKRCFAIMREECPMDENNFYYGDNE